MDKLYTEISETSKRFKVTPEGGNWGAGTVG